MGAQVCDLSLLYNKHNFTMHSQRAMAVPFDATGLGIVACNFNETTNRLATVGNDRIVKVWNAKPALGIK